jgi:tetratricopeptide (TPR) repeat protein
VPAEIAGIGSTAQKLRVSPGFDPLKAQIGPDEYFLFSRIDGTQTLRDVLLATGLPVERGVQAVLRLRSLGALLLPGERAAPAAPEPPRAAPRVAPASDVARPPAARAPTASEARAPIARPPTASDARTPRVSTASDASRAAAPPRTAPHVVPRADLRRGADALDNATAHRAPVEPATEPAHPSLDVSLPHPTADELRALSEPGVLDDAERRRILAMARVVATRDPYAILGLPRGADARALKRAYFKLSKAVHPDRYYGKQLGSFGDRLAAVFEAVSRAYARLTAPDSSAPSGSQQAVTAEQPQTPGEYATELFERACSVEVNGDALGAMKLFAAAVRIDPQTRYLRRAASCALAAQQPKTALEYAKKAQSQAPEDPSSARLLATAFRAAGRLADAEEVLLMAMALKNENDSLLFELQSDLAAVRRELRAAE